MRQKGTGPSQRQLRVGEEVRHILADVLKRGGTDSPLLERSSITVTEVKMSPDLRQATAYVYPLGGLHCDEILKELKIHSKYFSHEVAIKMTTKMSPKVFFLRDETFDEASKINALLRTPHVRRDLD